MELLSTIGQHIGVAVAKYRSDNEARRLSIVDERASLAPRDIVSRAMYL